MKPLKPLKPTKPSQLDTLTLLVCCLATCVVLFKWLLFGWLATLVLLSLLAIALFFTNSWLYKYKEFPNLWLISSGNISENICEDLIENDSKTSTVCLVCGDISCERHDSGFSVNVKPFKGLMIDKDVDDAVAEILELTLNHFVNYYLDDISITTKQLDRQLRHILRTLVSALIRRAMNVNVSDILLEKLPKVLANHLEMYVSGKRLSRTAQCIEETVLKQYQNLLHPAMNGREEEIKYLESVVDKVLPHLLPPKYMNSKVVECLFREVMACSVLLSIVDIIGDPDKINNLLVILLDESSLSADNKKIKSQNMVEILDRFVSTGCDKIYSNNLGINLKRILSDQQLLFLFQQFSKEEGFINLVQFILHITSFSQRILNPELSEHQLKELHTEVIHIFNSYFLPNSIDYIKFDQKIFNGFKTVAEGVPKDVEILRTTEPLYDAIDYIHNILETHYCPLFLESDLYFKLICGQRSSSFENLSPRRKKSSANIINARSISLESISEKNRLNETTNGSQDSLDDVFNNFPQYCEDPQSLVNEVTEWNGSDRIKDLSAWRVSIPKVETKIDANGREFDVFVIDIQRLDVQPDEKIDISWTVERRYNEFYVLESKLKEFHGQNLNNICLAPKRSFVKLSKSFLESRRPEMEKFLKQLLSSAHLKGSELVYNFLRSSEEFTTGFLADIRFGRMIRTVPAKFAKERGQHLEPFLLSLITSTEQIKPKPSKNEMSELLEYSPHEFAMTNLHKALYQNMGQWNDISSGGHNKPEVDSKPIYAQLDYVYDYLLFFLIRFYNAKESILKMLFVFRPLLRRTVQSLTEWYLRRKLKKSLLVSGRIVELINLLRDSLYMKKDSSLTSQQRRLRSQSAFKFAKQMIPQLIVTNVLGKEKHEEVMYLLFSLFQYPLLNKQLVYLVFDIIVNQLFPEIVLTDIPRGDHF